MRRTSATGRTVVAAAGLLGTAFALTIGAGAAHADAESFLEDVRPYGDAPDYALLGNGYWVCESLSQTTPASVAESLYYNGGYPMTWHQATRFVATAIVDLCPEYRY